MYWCRWLRYERTGQGGKTALQESMLERDSMNSLNAAKNFYGI